MNDAQTCTCNIGLLPLDGYSTVERIVVEHISPTPLYWQCPGCGARWHRYQPGHPLYYAADLFVRAAIVRPQVRKPQ
jgi:hypothetical protein